ncbi:MAG: DUF2267 domain-containing protein [Cyclobacteriaceae bacterium]
MALDFEKYAMKGNEFLHQLETNLGSADRGHAARILRSTFKVLRNHLTFEESLQLLSQLPMAIKCVYVEGWTRGENVRIKTVDDFLIEIIQAEGNSAWRDFGSKDEILLAVRAVVDTMRLYVSHEEMDQAIATLPRKIQSIFEPFTHSG